MTPGATEETVDGMSLQKINGIIKALKGEQYRWTPVRRIYIEKKHSKKKRPLGLPTWSDKLLQEVIRTILEAYYEPQMSDHAHGFRPERGCHTALREIYHQWAGTTWFIEGDISQCFDSLSHKILLDILQEHIHDGKFIQLIRQLLKAGYLEEWSYHATYSGSPQGGIISPILANIYLSKLDEYVQTTLIPAYTKGERRKDNRRYSILKATWANRKKRGQLEEAEALKREWKQLPSVDTHDPNYRRLRYVRYADDFLLGFIGPRSEAEQIKQQLKEYIHRGLQLELSETKTLITHARTQKARFLGYEIGIFQRDDALERGKRKRRVINGKVELSLPKTVIMEKCKRYTKAGKPIHRARIMHNTAFSIMAQYQAEYRGLAEYYRLAHNLPQLSRLKWVMEQSLTKTLAAKANATVGSIYRKYQAVLDVKGRVYKGLQIAVPRDGKKPLITQWGGISLQRQIDAVLNEQPKRIWNGRTELVERLLAETCELCGSQEDVEVHHIRALKDLNAHGHKEKPLWAKEMIARKRKTLILCRQCHMDVHAGRPIRTQRIRMKSLTGEPDTRKRVRPVRRGTDAKVLTEK